MSEWAKDQYIHKLEEEIRVLHAKDGVIKAITQLHEIAMMAPITHAVSSHGATLNRQLLERLVAEENFYLRKRVQELEGELRHALEGQPV